MVTPTEQTSPIFRLPDELFVNIFKYVCDPHLSVVCKKFYQIMKEDEIKRVLLGDIQRVFPYGRYLEWKYSDYHSVPVDAKLRLAYASFLDLTRMRIPFQHMGKRSEICFDYSYFQTAVEAHKATEYLNLVIFCRFFIGGERLIGGIVSSEVHIDEKKEMIINKLRNFLVPNRTEIDFSHRRLKEIPPEIGIFTNITKLNFHNNELTFLPKEIGDLPLLTNLCVSNNNLTFLPGSLWELRELRVLDLSSNPIRALPDDIGKLEKLTHLHLSLLLHEKLPETIGNLKQLVGLDLFGNFGLVELPESMGKLTSLRELHINNCQKINILPSWIGNLVRLETLSLHKTNITELPKELTHLVNLRKISFPKSVTQLPPGMDRLTNLQLIKIYKAQKETIEIPLKRLFRNLRIEYFDPTPHKTFSHRIQSMFRT